MSHTEVTYRIMSRGGVKATLKARHLADSGLVDQDTWKTFCQRDSQLVYCFLVEALPETTLQALLDKLDRSGIGSVETVKALTEKIEALEGEILTLRRPDVLYVNGKDGKTYFDEDTALWVLLREGVIFLGDEGKILAVCNDMFAWALADAEEVTGEEDMKDLYGWWSSDNTWGPVIWVCLKRQMKPQMPVEIAMRKGDIWPSIMDSLAENYYEKNRREDRERQEKEAPQPDREDAFPSGSDRTVSGVEPTTGRGEEQEDAA